MDQDLVKVDVRFRGNSEAFASELARGLQVEAGLNSPGGVTRLDRPGGAVLGAGTVIVTIVVSALLKDLVERGVHWLIEKVVRSWSQAQAKPDVSLQMAIEFQEKIVARCALLPEDSVEVVQEKTREWRQMIGAKLK